MPNTPTSERLRIAAITMGLGGIGAAAGHALALPAAILIGPAACVSLAALFGLTLEVPTLLRDAALLVLGLGIGAGLDAEAGGVILRWPLAFGVLVLSVAATLWICRTVLMRGFGFDRRSATLAAAPGHLNFVLSLAADLRSDVARITVVQSIRLLCLTLSVPFIARAMGYEITTLNLAPGAPMGVAALALLAGVSILLAQVFKHLRFPAPLLLAAMVVSALGHVANWTPGAVPQGLVTPALMVLGTMIGTRFSGTSRAQFAASLLAGLTTTAISVLIACLAAIPVAMALEMPTPHVLAGFAPGGLETMVALGAVMGASPGFVAACHILRLLILLLLIPLALGREPRGATPS